MIDLCSLSQSKNNAFSGGKESGKQESQDKLKHNAPDKMEVELRIIRRESTTKNEKVDSAMMCWESTNNSLKEEPLVEPEKEVKKPVEKTEKQRHEEEHVKPTINTGNQLKIFIEDFSWKREDDGSTLEVVEPEQQEIVYITNLVDSLQKDSTQLYDEEDPNKNSLLREIGLLKSPPKIILIMFSKCTKNLVVMLTTLEITLRERTKRT